MHGTENVWSLFPCFSTLPYLSMKLCVLLLLLVLVRLKRLTKEATAPRRIRSLSSCKILYWRMYGLH